MKIVLYGTEVELSDDESVVNRLNAAALMLIDALCQESDDSIQETESPVSA